MLWCLRDTQQCHCWSGREAGAGCPCPGSSCTSPDTQTPRSTFTIISWLLNYHFLLLLPPSPPSCLTFWSFCRPWMWSRSSTTLQLKVGECGTSELPLNPLHLSFISLWTHFASQFSAVSSLTLQFQGLLCLLAVSPALGTDWIPRFASCTRGGYF